MCGLVTASTPLNNATGNEQRKTFEVRLCRLASVRAIGAAGTAKTRRTGVSGVNAI